MDQRIQEWTPEAANGHPERESTKEVRKGMEGGKACWVARSFEGIARICKDHGLKSSEHVVIVTAELTRKTFESVPKHRLH